MTDIMLKDLKIRQNQFCHHSLCNFLLRTYVKIIKSVAVAMSANRQQTILTIKDKIEILQYLVACCNQEHSYSTAEALRKVPLIVKIICRNPCKSICVVLCKITGAVPHKTLDTCCKLVRIRKSIQL